MSFQPGRVILRRGMALLRQHGNAERRDLTPGSCAFYTKDPVKTPQASDFR